MIDDRSYSHFHFKANRRRNATPLSSSNSGNIYGSIPQNVSLPPAPPQFVDAVNSD